MADPYVGSAALPRGSRIILVVSQGPPSAPPQGYVQVPALVGESQGDALARLQDAGLRVRVFNDYSPTYKRGDVMGHVPRASVSVPAGSEVVLLVSSGPSTTDQGVVALPDLIGATEADAVARLQSGGLSPQAATEFSPTVPAGVVMDQLPNSADLATAPKKSKAWIWIALVAVLAVLAIGAFFMFRTPVVLVEVPDVVGFKQGEAVQTLEAAGFTVTFQDATDPGDAKEGEVAAQDPEAGTEAEEGSGVVLSIVGAPEPVSVPDLIGMTEQQATDKLDELGLRANPRTREDDGAKPGTVIEQSPKAGAQLIPGERVDITVAKEPAQPTQVKVPNVSGMSQSQAEKSLADAGVAIVVVQNPSDSVPKGDVIGQLPTAGTIVAPDSEVVIVVSSGPPATAATAPVPNVVGAELKDAEEQLADAGFKVEAVAVPGTAENAGDVLAQVPDAGTELAEGSTVTVLYAQ